MSRRARQSAEQDTQGNNLGEDDEGCKRKTLPTRKDGPSCVTYNCKDKNKTRKRKNVEEDDEKESPYEGEDAQDIDEDSDRLK